MLVYLSTRLNERKPSLHESIRVGNLYPTPGCISHEHPRSKYVFARHVAQGNKANMLYWRLHADEYKQVLGH